MKTLLLALEALKRMFQGDPGQCHLCRRPLPGDEVECMDCWSDRQY